MIINSRSLVSNLLFSSSCINWPKATLATPGLLATTRKASLWVRRAGIPIASPSSRARSGDTIGTRKLIVYPHPFPDCATGRAGREGAVATTDGTLGYGAPARRTDAGEGRARSGRRDQTAFRIPADLPRFDRPPRGNPFMDAPGQKTRVNALGAQYRRG